jgi:pimeloyl-ACP methyl ester carboxylesterase
MRVAWLQRFLFLALALATVLALAGELPPGGTAAVLIAVVAFPALLAFEMAWAARLAPEPGAPELPTECLSACRQPLGQWFAAWWGEVLSSLRVFGWWQPWRVHQCADWVSAEVGRCSGRRGVLLVHGYACNRAFWNGWMPRLRALGIPHVAVSLPNPFGDIDHQSQALDAAWQALIATTGRAPLLVGHSMGGLVIRAWCLRNPALAVQVPQVVTLGSPHHGTELARWGSSAAARAMRRTSQWLDRLEQGERQELPTLRARTVCYWSPCDNIVFPATTATLAGADNRIAAPVGHVALVDQPEILDAVCAMATGASAPSEGLE